MSVDTDAAASLSGLKRGGASNSRPGSESPTGDRRAPPFLKKLVTLREGQGSPNPVAPRIPRQKQASLKPSVLSTGLQLS